MWKVIWLIVYGEYLFIENFAIGAVLLYLTWKLISRWGEPAPHWWRFVLGAVVCGAGGFSIFLDVKFFIGVVLKISMGAAACAAAFGRYNIMKKAAIFFAISFLSGGAAMAVFMWLEVPALMGNGVFYLESITWSKLFGCGACAVGMVGWFVKWVKEKRKLDPAFGMVELEVEGEKCCLRGFVDSGNSLYEPLSRSPVILIDEIGAAMLPFSKSSYPQRYVLVPYHAVGVEHGVLEGIRLDSMDFEGRTMENVVLAYYGGRFSDFEVLLHRDVLEGGMLGDEEVLAEVQ